MLEGAALGVTARGAERGGVMLPLKSGCAAAYSPDRSAHYDERNRRPVMWQDTLTKSVAWVGGCFAQKLLLSTIQYLKQTPRTRGLERNFIIQIFKYVFGLRFFAGGRFMT